MKKEILTKTELLNLTKMRSKMTFKELRKAYKTILDWDLEEFEKDAEEKIDFLDNEEAEIHSFYTDYVSDVSVKLFIEKINRISKYEWSFTRGWHNFIISASKKEL